MWRREKKRRARANRISPFFFFNVPFFSPTLQDFGVDRLALHRLSRLEARADSLRAAQQRGEWFGEYFLIFYIQVQKYSEYT